MQGRTYRYYKGALQYPFGFGLSYTSFGYTWNKEPQTTWDTISNAWKLYYGNYTLCFGNNTNDCLLKIYDQLGIEERNKKAFKSFRVLLLKAFLSAQNRIRTCTSLRTLPPEGSASTNFAIWATKAEGLWF